MLSNVLVLKRKAYKDVTPEVDVAASDKVSRNPKDSKRLN